MSVRYRAEDEISDLAEIRIAVILHSHMNRDAEKLRKNSIRDITEPKQAQNISNFTFRPKNPRNQNDSMK